MDGAAVGTPRDKDGGVVTTPVLRSFSRRRHRALKRVSLAGCAKIKGDSLVVFKNLPVLADLDLNGTLLGFDKTAVDNLCKFLALKDCPLKCLQLEGCGLDYSGMTKLADTLKDNTSLVYVEMRTHTYRGGTIAGLVVGLCIDCGVHCQTAAPFLRVGGGLDAQQSTRFTCWRWPRRTAEHTLHLLLCVDFSTARQVPSPAGQPDRRPRSGRSRRPPRQ